MNPPCNHKPRLRERGKCEALSFSLSLSLSLSPSSLHLKETCRAYKYFLASNKKIRQKQFCFEVRQGNEFILIDIGISIKNAFLSKCLKIKKLTVGQKYLVSRILTNSRRAGLVRWWRSLYWSQHFWFSSFFLLPHKTEGGVRSREDNKTFFMSFPELHKGSAKPIKLSFDYHFTTSKNFRDSGWKLSQNVLLWVDGVFERVCATKLSVMEARNPLLHLLLLLLRFLYDQLSLSLSLFNSKPVS